MKKALTIGELLVTMSIIGIIATLVLPGFMQDYHKKIYVTKLKKTIEKIEAAVTQACTDNSVSYFYQTPYAEGYEWEKQKAFLKKYFKVTKETSPSVTYKAIHGTGTETINYHFVLEDGEYITFQCYREDNDNCEFFFDINGSEGPNIGGRDKFIVQLNRKTNKIQANSFGASLCGGDVRGSNESENAYIARLASSTDYLANGNGCFSRIVTDNWEMKY